MRIMRLHEVMSVTGLGRSSVYKYMAHGTFPKPVLLGEKAVGWVSTEIEDWVKARITERDQRCIVSQRDTCASTREASI